MQTDSGCTKGVVLRGMNDSMPHPHLAGSTLPDLRIVAAPISGVVRFHILLATVGVRSKFSLSS